MFTRGPTQRGVLRRGAAVRRRRWAEALFIAAFSSGCLQVLGDVDVVGEDPPLGTGRAVLAEFPADCRDAGAGPCADARCTPDRLRCDGELLEVCAPSGKAWGLLEPCATRGLCDSVAGVCRSPVCEPRQYDCAETGDLVVCNADRTGFDPVAHCSSRAFCNSVRGQEGCEPPACNIGDRRCNGAQLEECRSDQMGYEPILPACVSAALCKQDAPGKAHCAPPTCTAGQYSCDGRELRLCNEESSAWTVLDRCVSTPLCNTASRRCDPVVCQLGEQRCTGTRLERCNPEQSGFTPVVDCPPPLFCDVRVPTCLTEPPPPTPTPVPLPPALPPEVAP